MTACPWQVVPRYNVSLSIDTQLGAIEEYCDYCIINAGLVSYYNVTLTAVNHTAVSFIVPNNNSMSSQSNNVTTITTVLNPTSVKLVFDNRNKDVLSGITRMGLVQLDHHCRARRHDRHASGVCAAVCSRTLR